ncbi:hypothetical protein H4R18_000437 [Coemansia javaensis]|uniref:HpcH/HpaI aldolase/citrate lyase domain-containing protein n=1 Tax=Coemansia javaensis TaxID=2761396 RepID=A0A9W8HG75_9FUNG|nr:hypothetical protein H4R18_000437 [Coemansia javaensis]
MAAHNDGDGDGDGGAPADAPAPLRRAASAERPIRVVLETEPPARKPGRPRLDISAHFQDTGEMANHSHRLVWCIGCIKSGRLLYKKDRLPARGDLMQRHLQTCKHVTDEVRQKFCSARSSSASSAGEARPKKARTTSSSAASEPRVPGAHGGSGGRARSHSRLRAATSSMAALSMPTPSMPMAAPHAPVLPPISAVASPAPSAGDAEGVQLPRIRSPRPLPPAAAAAAAAAAAGDLPLLPHRAHPSLAGDPLPAQPNGSAHRRSPPHIHTPPGPYPHRPYLAPPLPHAMRSSPVAAYGGVPPPEPGYAAGAPPADAAPGPAAALRRKLHYTRDVAHGIVLTVPSTSMAQAAARLGFDWACIDVECPPLPAGAMAEMIAAVASAGSCAALVRVPAPTSEWVRWAVDAGAHGVVIPGVQSSAQMRLLAAALRESSGRPGSHAPLLPAMYCGPPGHPHYAPHAGPGPQPAGVVPAPAAPADALLIPQIDPFGAAGLGAEELLSTPGVDAALVRVAGAAGCTSRALDDILGRILRAGRQVGVPLGIDGADGSTAHHHHHGARLGFRMASVGRDVDILASGAADRLRLARSS